jgi:hypothetical protein
MTDKKEKSLARGLLDSSSQLEERAFASPVFAELKSRSKRVDVDGEQLYVVEGDLLMDEDELAVYALQRETLEQVREQARQVGLAPLLEPDAKELVGHIVAGQLIRWRPGAELTYCVLRGTFQDQGRYQMVRDNMDKATANWQDTCGVVFRHVADLDNSPGTANPGVLFTVREFDSQGQFIAAAFFPGDPQNRRRMLIDRTQYFDDSPGGFDKVGILRHELGHVLGFRHEHIRSEAPAICPDEDPGMDLTAYDPQSVMHYFCGGVGSRLLAITELDKIGSQRLYGPSFNDVQYADV